MANVFVSYARDDRARIQPLVSALEAEGLSVWWDPALIPGRRFRQMIAQELSNADSVLVIWTRQALESDWVQDEAEEARQRGVLIPVIMEPVQPPAGFRQLQAADLSQWTGQAAHPEFKALIHACRSLVQWAEQERAATHAATDPTPAQTVALVANPIPVADLGSPETGIARGVEPEPESEAAPPPKRPVELDLEPPPLPTPPPPPREETKLAVELRGPQLVRALGANWVGWTLTLAMLFLLAVVLTRGHANTVFSTIATIGCSGGVLSGILSRALQRRDFPPIAVKAALAGAAVGGLSWFTLVMRDTPSLGQLDELAAVVLVLLFFSTIGYSLCAGLALAVTAKTPRSAPSPAKPGAPPTPLGFVPGLLTFLADRWIKWWMAGVGGICGVIFFFSRDQRVAGLTVAVMSLISLPAAMVAKRMLDRGAPRGPVISGLVGGGLAMAYALLVAVAALSLGPMGVFGAVSAVLLFPLLGFVLFGGVANLLSSQSKTPPAVG